MPEIPARARRWVRETLVRFVNARDALLAEGRVRSVGRVRVLRVYDRPCIQIISIYVEGIGEKRAMCGLRGGVIL